MLSSTRSVNKNSPLPYYYQIERYLKEELDRGRWKKGDALPSELELANSFKVNKSVIRRALDRLEQEGLILRQKGKRAVVIAKPKIQLEFIQKTLSLYDEIKVKGLSVKTKVLENKVVCPSEKLQGILKIDSSQKVIKISRLRFIEQRPMIFWTSYLPAHLCPDLEKKDLTDKSLYEILQNTYKLRIYSAKRTLEVVISGKYESNLLKLPMGESIIYIESIGYLQNKQPLEFYEAWHRADNCKFVFVSSDESFNKSISE